MRLWIDTAMLGTAGQEVRAKVEEMKARVNQQVLSRGTRAVNELRNAELEVLRGQGGGRVYGNHTASAPGQPPAVDSGNLRMHWNGNVAGGGSSITIELEAAEFYAGFLEYGTSKMAPRPYKDKITQKALPSIIAIFNEPYL